MDTERPRIFVFGSNEAGIHGAGAALHARNHCAAQLGVGVGPTGNAYAIPTKDMNIKTLPLDSIRKHVEVFKDYARLHPELTFEVTRIGCGLAGYTDSQISPMFADAPNNCWLPKTWRPVLTREQVNAAHERNMKRLEVHGFGSKK